MAARSARGVCECGGEPRGVHVPTGETDIAQQQGHWLGHTLPYVTCICAYQAICMLVYELPFPWVRASIFLAGWLQSRGCLVASLPGGPVCRRSRCAAYMSEPAGIVCVFMPWVLVELTVRKDIDKEWKKRNLQVNARVVIEKDKIKTKRAERKL